MAALLQQTNEEESRYDTELRYTGSRTYILDRTNFIKGVVR